MVYEWDEKRARRNHWSRVSLTCVLVAAAIAVSVWIASALGLWV